jgi:hypothetical protein
MLVAAKRYVGLTAKAVIYGLPRLGSGADQLVPLSVVRYAPPLLEPEVPAKRLVPLKARALTVPLLGNEPFVCTHWAGDADHTNNRMARLETTLTYKCFTGFSFPKFRWDNRG